MVRCLLGVLFVTAGLVALASTNRRALTLQDKPVSNGGPRLRQTEEVATTGVCRILLRPLPAPDMGFSLN